jgi:hypothetical protein
MHVRAIEKKNLIKFLNLIKTYIAFYSQYQRFIILCFIDIKKFDFFFLWDWFTTMITLDWHIFSIGAFLYIVFQTEILGTALTIRKISSYKFFIRKLIWRCFTCIANSITYVNKFIIKPISKGLINCNGLFFFFFFFIIQRLLTCTKAYKWTWNNLILLSLLVLMLVLG